MASQNPEKKLLVELPNNSSTNEYNKLSDIVIEKEFIALLHSCSKEKRDSQKQLYYIFYDYAMNICSRYTNNKEEALEIVNDGFLKIFKHIQQFKTNSVNTVASFKAWLKKIMIFTAIDAYRKKKPQFTSIDTDAAEELIAYDIDSINTLAYKDIMACIMELTPVYRAVFCMFIIDGFSHEEIANCLGIATGTSKSNLAKARIQLQKKLMAKQNFISYEQRAV